MNEVRFEIKKHHGVLKTNQNGWRRELNIVEWNGGEPKYDIREWSPDHTRMTRGLTFTPSEMHKLTQILMFLFEDSYRVCSECGSVMVEGFVIGGGDEYYCSEECLHKHYTQEEYLKMYEENDDDNYWTQW